MEFKPHDYQSRAIEKIVENDAAGLLLEMGLGKTVVTLTAIKKLLRERWAVRKVLIIAPKKVAEATWQAEAQKWEHLKDLKFSTVLGTAQQRQRALSAEAEVYVINRENIPWLVKTLMNDWFFDMVVVDESTSFKNSQSQRFKALKAVRERIRRMVILTGTPAPNSLEDLWSQIYLLDKGKRLGRTITAYREAYFTQDRAFPGQTYRTYTAQPDAQERIEKKIEDICLSMKAADYLSLPPYVEHTVPVVLDAKAQKAYQKLEKEMLLEVAESEITAGSAAVLNGKLLQLCSGCAYDADQKPVEIHRCKLEAFSELLEQLNGEHALVFYWYQHERDRLSELLGGRARVYRGAEDERAWNAGEVEVLLAHPASCGYGLNLQQGGHHIVWFGYPNWALELYQQANARLYRQGQTKPVIVHHMTVVGSMEESMVRALHSKGEMQDALMDALKDRVSRAKLTERS